VLVQLAWFARECRLPQEACAAAAEAVEISVRLEFDAMMLAGVDEFAAALEDLANRERAAVLRGFADRRRTHVTVNSQFDEHAARHAVLRDAARAAHPGAYARGEHAALEEILALLAPENVQFETS
jgi:hypothetical protein